MSAFSTTRTRPTATLTESITTGGARKRTKRPYDTDVTRLLPRWLLVVVIAVIIAFIAAPVLYILFGSVNSDVAVARGEYFPSEFTLANYVEIWNTVALGQGLVNSLLTAGAVAVDRLRPGPVPVPCSPSPGPSCSCRCSSSSRTSRARPVCRSSAPAGASSSPT
ncbi:hypothetical protein [Curtobacterium sp. Csp1]|uniref:hypothetical protein n=1 Tax=Curtobacterium sp. Csp1 TaxID=2495429 RepID=UPI0020C70A08|nr:hypothetical protein [Curtobacterium sp. Csp1]